MPSLFFVLVIVVQHVRVKCKCLQYCSHSDLSSVCLGFPVDCLYIINMVIQVQAYEYFVNFSIPSLLSLLPSSCKSMEFSLGLLRFFHFFLCVRKHLSHYLLSSTMRGTIFLVNKSLNLLTLGARLLSTTPVISKVKFL